MRILFCTDGSKISYNALKNFKKWVKDTIVDVICVIDWTFLPSEVSIEEEGFANSCANVADGILEYAKKEIANLELTTGELIKHCGAVTESILEQLDRQKYDFVVMGSHGKKGIQKWLGSVSRQIVLNGKVYSFISKKENPGKNILFTTDGTIDSLKTITKTIQELDLHNKKIYICMVNEEPDLLFLEGTLDTNWLLAIEQQQQSYAAKAIQEIHQILDGHSLEVMESAILTGNIAQKIIDYADDKKIDLIIMGSKEKTKMDSFLNGSVSRRVLENTLSDVIIGKKQK